MKAFARRLGEPWRLPRQGRSTPVGLGEPLFFHHIPKTGGTSLIEAIKAVTPAQLCFTERPDLSAAFAEALVARGLTQGQFIYGHPLPGAARALRGKARIVSLLREPCDNAISNYFWVRGDPELPGHAAAQALGLRAFLIAHPYFLVFQTGSLNLGIAERPPANAQDLIDQTPAVLAYLEEMHAVSTPELANRLFARLAAANGIDRPPRFPHRRKSRISGLRRGQLRREFAQLYDEPALAPLMAAERAVYEKALLLTRVVSQFPKLEARGL